MTASADEVPHSGSGLELSVGHFPETRWSVIAGVQVTGALDALDEAVTDPADFENSLSQTSVNPALRLVPNTSQTKINDLLADGQ